MSTAEFYGTLLNGEWVPNEVFGRLTDSLFLFLDDIPGPLQGTGQMELPKLDIFLPAENHELPDIVRATMLRYMFGSANVEFSLAEDSNGLEYPILDRQNFLLYSIFEFKCDPDTEVVNWNRFIEKLELLDPLTGQTFPHPIPRSCFPRDADEVARESRQRAVSRFALMSDMVLDEPPAHPEHDPSHIGYRKIRKTNGTVKCDVCHSVINGVRFKCLKCADFNKCLRCDRDVIVDQPHLPTHESERWWGTPGSWTCDSCGLSENRFRNHCLQCENYDECEDCAGMTAVRAVLDDSQGGELTINIHRNWHSTRRLISPIGSWHCDVCNSTQYSRNKCLECPDFSECDDCLAERTSHNDSPATGIEINNNAFTSPLHSPEVVRPPPLVSPTTRNTTRRRDEVRDMISGFSRLFRSGRKA